MKYLPSANLSSNVWYGIGYDGNVCLCSTLDKLNNKCDSFQKVKRRIFVVRKLRGQMF